MLATAVGVLNQSRRWPAKRGSPEQRLNDQVPRHSLVHRVANDFAGIQVLQPSQVQPAFISFAETTVAPINGAIITGIVRLEAVGWNMRNVELLPDTGYEPVYARFIVSEDGRTAYVDFDTRTVPNGALDVRISAFNRFADEPDSGEFVAMRPHTWFVLN
jgi:hypothetical protein